jgi:uncharacterized DUF497 family protein
VDTLEFEWHPAKAASNVVDHGVRFSTAALIFRDPGRIVVADDREDYGEERWKTIGFVGPVLLSVVYTYRGESLIRLISARKADALERQEYGELQTRSEES